jgi:putative photosynthetic complex assembly protein
MVKAVTKPALFGAAAAVAVLSIVIVMNFAGTRTVDLTPQRTAAYTRSIVFRDGPNGAIAVYDQGADQPFVVLPREGNTFMASAIRLLGVRRELKTKAGPDAPFTLTQWSDGQLSLFDPATGDYLELSAFGKTNAATFFQLLPPTSKSK